MYSVYNREVLFEVYDLISAQTELIKSETICGDTDTGRLWIYAVGWKLVKQMIDSILGGN